MKPSLGKVVYCVYRDSIIVEKVYAIGKDSFFISSVGDESTMSDSWEYWYEEYNKTWFTSLTKAKNQLVENGLEMYKEVGKVKKKFR